jgi:hypothetical protein
VIWRVNKPWTRAGRLHISKRDDVAVVGDRLLPDGLLAWRLGADFFMITRCTDRRASPSGIGGRLAAAARRRLFDEESPGWWNGDNEVDLNCGDE